MRDLAADLVIEDLLEQLSSIDPDTKWKKYKLVLIDYIRKANTSALDECEAFASNAMAYQLAKMLAYHTREKIISRILPLIRLASRHCLLSIGT